MSIKVCEIEPTRDEIDGFWLGCGFSYSPVSDFGESYWHCHYRYLPLDRPDMRLERYLGLETPNLDLKNLFLYALPYFSTKINVFELAETISLWAHYVIHLRVKYPEYYLFWVLKDLMEKEKK